MGIFQRNSNSNLRAKVTFVILCRIISPRFCLNRRMISPLFVSRKVIMWIGFKNLFRKENILNLYMNNLKKQSSFFKEKWFN